MHTYRQFFEPDVESLFERSFGINGDDFEEAIIQMQSNHALVGINVRDLHTYECMLMVMYVGIPILRTRTK